MKPAIVLGIAVLTLGFGRDTRAISLAQITSLDQAVGKWNSTERFEGEPRISVAFRQGARSLEGWALLLGQHRKNDDRATLGLSFSEASWSERRLRFSTILPEDEGTIGWELEVLTPTTAVPRALSENGEPLQEELKWDMTR